MERIVEFRVVTRELSERAWLVAVSGELDLATAPRLREALQELPAEAAWLVVDLLGVTFVDSAGLSLLTTAARRLRSAGGGAVLAVADRNILRVLRLTGLDRYFDVRTTVADAAARALAG